MRINGLGCSLVDNLYSPVSFGSDSYKKWSGNNSSGTSIITGGLVFGEDLEGFFGESYKDILNEITGKKLTPQKNVGGPAIVALINIIQMVKENEISVGYFGARADDKNGCYIIEQLSPFGIDLRGYIVVDGQTPFTDVLSDPSYNNYNGERSFVNYIGVASKLDGRDIPDSFYNADILIYGGTALTPGLHEDLSFLLKKGKKAKSLNFVNTVYDFKNENLNPDKSWPLVSKDDDFMLIDLLIADNEEALKISGQGTKEEAVQFFAEKGVSSVIITHGSEDVFCFSDGTFFTENESFYLPVSDLAGTKMKNTKECNSADTTGCGDNFAGGVYTSTAIQIKNNRMEKPSLKLASAWGVVSGGFAGLYQGGVYYEKKEGEKLEKLTVLFEDYKLQIGDNFE